MKKQELLQQLNTWMSEHRNPYDHSINEKVYWTMDDLLTIVKNTESEIVINKCDNLFNRFKYYC